MTNEAAAKRANRVAKEAARLAANRSWNVTQGHVDTRQSVRAEGRRLEARMADRRKAEATPARRKPRRTASMIASFQAHRTAVATFKRHDFGLHGAAKKAVRDARAAAREAASRAFPFAA